MNRLTKIERENGIGYKSLVIAKDRQGNIARVMSPCTCTSWLFDGNTWTLDADNNPQENNKSGVYVAFDAKTAKKYLGNLCKVMLSGDVIIHETGARGQRARLLEIGGRN